MHRLREFLKQPFSPPNDELTWGAIVLTFLAALMIIVMAATS